jgi:hypothetical protein
MCGVCFTSEKFCATGILVLAVASNIQPGGVRPPLGGFSLPYIDTDRISIKIYFLLLPAIHY